MPVHILPEDALITEPRRITMTSLAKGPARLVTSIEKPDGSYWCSVALFMVDESGRLDLQDDAPFSGDWGVADPMALVWSMRNIRRASRPEQSDGIEPLTVNVLLTDAAGEKHTGKFIQRFLAHGVTCQAIEQPGLVGSVFFPATPGPHPVVFGLNGSNGGMPLQRCALYAANGYIAVALAFFGAPGRPRYFGDTSLEYFAEAFAWAKSTLHPKDGFIAVAGSSRGGELSFLLASLYPEYIKAVIAFVPSAVVNGIQQAGRPELPRDTPAWYHGGEALPNLWLGNPDADVTAYTTPQGPGLPIRQAGAFCDAIKNEAFLEKSRIPVERINGPVIMVSAEDDGCWPSQLFCEMIEERLTAHDHPWRVEHVRNPLAGHSVMFPYIPINETVVTHPVSGLVMDFGGTVPDNARSGRESWAKVMEFMRLAPEYYAQGREKTCI